MTRNDLVVAETMTITKVKDDEDTATGTRRMTTAKSVERDEGMMKPRRRGRKDAEGERKGKGSGSGKGDETGRATRATGEDIGPAATGLRRGNPTVLNDPTDPTDHPLATSIWIENVFGSERMNDAWQKIDADGTTESGVRDTMRYVSE